MSLKYDIEAITLHFANSTAWEELRLPLSLSREIQMANAPSMQQQAQVRLEFKSATIEPSNLDGGSWSYTSRFTLPKLDNRDGVGRKVEICWKVMYIPNQEGVHEWETTSHVCNFSHHWIPRSRAEFFHRFLHEIREQWLTTCIAALQLSNTEVGFVYYCLDHTKCLG